MLYVLNAWNHLTVRNCIMYWCMAATTSIPVVSGLLQNRLMARIKPKSGYEFLQSVGHATFRTFLPLCATYTTIGSFLGTMKDSSKNDLMSEFVSNLDNTLEGDLKVQRMANSFGSITDSNLMKTLLKPSDSTAKRIVCKTM
ncbi:MAG: hypothetical protein IPN26_10720 [Bacteroidetes bacterium]|nr:hypothetical protein [Bacteroidota bacterium]